MKRRYGFCYYFREEDRNPEASAMPDFEQIMASPIAAYDEALAFVGGHGMLNKALLRIAADLERHGIAYAVIGAVALNQHGYKRLTVDIDLLMTKEGLQTFRDQLVGLGYRPAFPGASKQFKTSEDNVLIEIITAGEYPGDGKPKSIVFPDPGEYSEDIAGVKTMTLPKLLELKLASGMTGRGRLKDLADVQEMIKAKGLKEDFAENLDESVREKFREIHRDTAPEAGS